ncbi:MAG: cupin domain-containing protein [Pseudomonadota bacterium]
MSEASLLQQTMSSPVGWNMSLAAARDAITQALNAGDSPLGLPEALLLERGTLKLYFYEPRGEDKQTPHDQDEVYVVMRGSGIFAIGENKDSLDRFSVQPGDVIFTQARALHRFEDFTDDFGTYVIMYGTKGGETRHA